MNAATRDAPTTLPWYRQAFGAAYLDLYAHRDLKDAARAVELILEATPMNRATRLLDLCCGPGRHLALLAPHVGYATGLDLSRRLLERARLHLKQSELHFRLVEADMRSPPFAPGSFDLIVNLFTSFGYFADDAENERVIIEIARLLTPGGTLVLDHLNAEHLGLNLQGESFRDLSDGGRVREIRSLHASTRRVVKRIEGSSSDGLEWGWEESVRYYELDEIRAILSRAGLRVAATFGDYERQPFNADSPRMILVAEK